MDLQQKDYEDQTMKILKHLPSVSLIEAVALTPIYSPRRPLLPLATPSGAGEADFHRKGLQVSAGERLIVLGLVWRGGADASGSSNNGHKTNDEKRKPGHLKQQSKVREGQMEN